MEPLCASQRGLSGQGDEQLRSEVWMHIAFENRTRSKPGGRQAHSRSLIRDSGEQLS